MENPKISVIVAVYKAEAYLHRCVDSLLAQTFQDFEILLIDDGSPDHSGKICDDYAKQDARIRVFHKENGGVGSARQCGIDHARGEYTTHVDPDDWVEPTMLEEMYAKAKEDDADMVLADWYLEYVDDTKYVNQQPSSLDVKTVLSDFLCFKLKISLCGRLICTSCYKNSHIIFPLNIAYGEDNSVLIKMLCKMRKISYLPYAYYHYDSYSNSNSLSRNRKDIASVYDMIFNSYKDDLYAFSHQLYRMHFSLLAYLIFIDDLLLASDYKKKYYKSLLVFLRSSVTIKVKFFIILSALGYKDIAYRLYVFFERKIRPFLFKES